MVTDIFLAGEIVTSNEHWLLDTLDEIRVQQAVVFLIEVSSLQADRQLQ